MNLLDTHNIHVCLLPPNTTDQLQPMDISVNKPAKDFIMRQFDNWYSKQVLKQLEGEDTSDLESLELQPINLSLPEMKEMGAKWLVDMASYISDNPQLVVNGFIHSGIAGALDGWEGDEMDGLGSDEQELNSEDEFDECEIELDSDEYEADN